MNKNPKVMFLKKTSISLIFIVFINLTTQAQDEKISSLIEQMTLEEKASLCSGKDIWSTKAIDRLNIPSIWMTDGPHGLRKAARSGGFGIGNSLPATCFPTASALASSWDTALIFQVGKALGQECQAQGVQILLGPGVNMKRSPLGGRNFEYFSEDPLLAGEMAASFINGVQNEGVGTSLKHYCCNNQEFERMVISSEIDIRTLHEIYLRAFEIAVKKAQPWTVMAAYNKVNGVYAAENKFLLNDVLKENWGFKGFVVSDWGAVNDRPEGIKSGMHLEMPGVGGINDQKIIKAVEEGRLEENVLDRIVTDYLRIVLKADASKKENASFDKNEHHSFARKVASECIVLLKNEDQILPLNASQKQSIAIIGGFAKDPRYQGAGSSQVNPILLENAFDKIVTLAGRRTKVFLLPVMMKIIKPFHPL